ncbi:MAG: S8 family serine peptidase [Bacteroidetes bacterium]|nr:S8 family serine peptidase [Bacteroidota bacterium]MCY4205243.1 S8 family serine peptidase [Bacteroidota bacterium]
MTSGKKNFQILLVLALGFSQIVIAQDLRPEFKDQIVVVQFAPEIAVENGKTDHSGINRLLFKYQVHTIEPVYPILDHIEPTPKIRKNLLALRRTFFIHYGVQENPLKISGDFVLAPGVVYAEPVLVNRMYGSISQEIPNDPLYQEQQSYLNLVQLPEAWDLAKSENVPGEDTARVIIAIVDTGGDWDHEDLLENVWINEDEVPNNGIDDDNNSYIDDIHGINLGNMDEMDNDPALPEEWPMEYAHGTTVAGAASAVTDNEIGISGAAWNASLMHINVLCLEEETDCSYRGLMYAAVNGADIINASWGAIAFDFQLQFITQSLDLITDLGSLVVAAVGNEGNNADILRTYPDAHPRVLSVGSTQRDSYQLSKFSNYGKTVDVYAPGERIITTFPDDLYDEFDGTSLSAPLVSGIAALVKTRFPDLSADELREQIRLSATNIASENPSYEETLSGGMINAEASLTPSLVPAVRVQRWSWEDNDGNSQIDPGDEVTIKINLINYLADTQQLNVTITPLETYPYITLKDSEQSVGILSTGDSTTVEFKILISPSTPPNRSVYFSLHIQDGSFTDESDVLSLRTHTRVDLIYEALSALYKSTDGDNWTDNSGWNITRLPTLVQLSTWFGVVVLDGKVEILNLIANNLSGVIPPEFGQFPGLRELWLPSNKLSGSIPKELSGLIDLETLILSANQLSGPIPPELGQLSRLKGILIERNSLTGPIPPEFGDLSDIQFIRLSENQLSGLIPPELGKLTKLLNLSLRDNQLSGTIPSELGQLSRLEDLDLSNNNLMGSLPREFTMLENLKSLDIGGQELCVPSDNEFQDWLNDLQFFNGRTCIQVGLEEAIIDESLPEKFVLHGNYPNPFQTITRLTFDLPRESHIQVEVVDVIGRRILRIPVNRMSAGWERSIRLNGSPLPPGIYLYRLIADSAEGRLIQTGRFVKARR